MNIKRNIIFALESRKKNGCLLYTSVMEKEDPTNPEFVVPAKLKELYEAKDFGRYALPVSYTHLDVYKRQAVLGVIQLKLGSWFRKYPQKKTV